MVADRLFHILQLGCVQDDKDDGDNKVKIPPNPVNVDSPDKKTHGYKRNYVTDDIDGEPGLLQLTHLPCAIEAKQAADKSEGSKMGRRLSNVRRVNLRWSGPIMFFTKPGSWSN